MESSVSYSQSFLKCRSTKLVLQSGISTKILSISNFTSKLLKCFVLEQSVFKIQQLKRLLVKIVSFVNEPGFSTQEFMEHKSLVTLSNLRLSRNQKYSKLRQPLQKFNSLFKAEPVYEGRLKVILLLQVISHEFEPIPLLCWF